MYLELKRLPAFPTVITLLRYPTAVHVAETDIV
jgi:hypothetical protein